MKATQPVTKFLGLNNVADPLQLGLKWLVKARDVIVGRTGSLLRRAGYTKIFSATMRGAYATDDRSRFYAVRGTTLLSIGKDMATATLRSGLAPRLMQWAEVNRQVYFTNGVDSGIITPDGVVLPWAWLPPAAPRFAPAGAGRLSAGVYQALCTFVLDDGRETGASDAVATLITPHAQLRLIDIPQLANARTRVYIATPGATVFRLAIETTGTAASWDDAPEALGAELATRFAEPLPSNTQALAFWRSRLHSAHFVQDASVIWSSQPLAFHLFSLAVDFVMVPGRVAMLAPLEDALIIATDACIYAYDGEKIEHLADYGAPQGTGWAHDDDGSVVFWTHRGACRAMPFANLTQTAVSGTPGRRAAAAIVERDGQKHFIVAVRDGGEAYNPREPRGTPP